MKQSFFLKSYSLSIADILTPPLSSWILVTSLCSCMVVQQPQKKVDRQSFSAVPDIPRIPLKVFVNILMQGSFDVINKIIESEMIIVQITIDVAND